MKLLFMTLIAGLFGLTLTTEAKVEFKEQSISSTIPEAKAQQKLILSVCSSVECYYCKWMDKYVYSDESFATKVNDQLIAIKPTAQLNRLEFYSNCQILPSMLFFDENGKLIRKEEGKRTLAQMDEIVNEVLSSNCTGLDEKLDESQGTRKSSVCCQGLVKKSQGENNVCAKQACVEAEDHLVSFPGLPSDALPCCDDSAKRLIHPKMGGANARRFGKEFKPEFRVECIAQSSSKEINQTGRFNKPHKSGGNKKIKEKILGPAGNPF